MRSSLIRSAREQVGLSIPALQPLDFLGARPRVDQRGVTHLDELPIRNLPAREGFDQVLHAIENEPKRLVQRGCGGGKM